MLVLVISQIETLVAFVFIVKLRKTFTYIFFFILKSRKKLSKFNSPPSSVVSIWQVLSQIQFPIPNQDNLCCPNELRQINYLSFY